MILILLAMILGASVQAEGLEGRIFGEVSSSLMASHVDRESIYTLSFLPEGRVRIGFPSNLNKPAKICYYHLQAVSKEKSVKVICPTEKGEDVEEYRASSNLRMLRNDHRKLRFIAGAVF